MTKGHNFDAPHQSVESKVSRREECAVGSTHTEKKKERVHSRQQTHTGGKKERKPGRAGVSESYHRAKSSPSPFAS